MIGPKYWSTGINIVPDDEKGRPRRWGVHMEFVDDGFAVQGSTNGTLYCRYAENDVVKAVNMLKEDAEKLGIHFGSINNELKPCIYWPGDGEDPKYPFTEEDRELVRQLCASLGWRNVYTYLDKETG